MYRVPFATFPSTLGVVRKLNETWRFRAVFFLRESKVCAGATFMCSKVVDTKLCHFENGSCEKSVKAARSVNHSVDGPKIIKS